MQLWSKGNCRVIMIVKYKRFNEFISKIPFHSYFLHASLCIPPCLLVVLWLAHCSNLIKTKMVNLSSTMLFNKSYNLNLIDNLVACSYSWQLYLNMILILYLCTSCAIWYCIEWFLRINDLNCLFYKFLWIVIIFRLKYFFTF